MSTERQRLLDRLTELGIGVNSAYLCHISNPTGDVTKESDRALADYIRHLEEHPEASDSLSCEPVKDELIVTSSQIATEAVEIVHGDREKTYGEPGANLRTIAAYWSAHLDKDISTTDVCIMMKLLKMARLKTSPDHHDSWVDDIGYSILNERVEVTNA